jgi:hypothetical protein
MLHTGYGHVIGMMVIMILSGLLSTMNVWANSIADVRLSLNDAYMIALMTGWMFLFMGGLYGDVALAVGGGILVAASFWAIRTQFLVTPRQFIQGMIPHHSMAVHMSRQLLAKEAAKDNPRLAAFATGIIKQQEAEIAFMKEL